MQVNTFSAALAAAGMLLGPVAAGAQQGEPDRQSQVTTQAEAEPSRPATSQNDSARGAVEARIKTHMRSNELIGLKVKNNTGEDLGDVNDLLVDLREGEVKHVVMSFGGFLGVGSRLFAVPWEKAHFRHAEDDKFFLYNVTEEQLENAPSFERDKWPNVNDPEWRSTVDRHYGTARQARQPAPQDRPSREDTIQPQQQPRTVHSPNRPRPDVRTQQRGQVEHDTIYRASTLKDLRVRNQTGEELGSIDELIINVQRGSVDYATLTHGATLGVGGRTVAVPFDRFGIKHTEDDQHLVLNATEEQLRTAKQFSRNSLNDQSWARDVDQHFNSTRTAEQPADPVRRQ